MFETPRLKFDITNQADIPALQACLNDPEMCKIISFLSYPYTIDDAKDWVEKAHQGLENKTEWLFSAKLHSNNEYIGSINLHCKSVSLNESGEGEAEIGYWLKQSCWNQGYGSEMLAGAIRYGFDVLQLRSIYAVTALDNKASIKMLEKNGFIREVDKKTKSSSGERQSRFYRLYSNQI